MKNLFFAAYAVAILGACTPAIRREVAPTTMYAKLDTDVHVRLEKEVNNAIRKNPDLF